MSYRGEQIINGTIYVYEAEAIWDPVKNAPSRKELTSEREIPKPANLFRTKGITNFTIRPLNKKMLIYPL